jgi:DNA invertase Pin-like site-specific DNA recombinase
LQNLHAYHDRAMSGTSHLRPGYQKLLEDARSGVFDAVVAEALDRLSRDQEHVAHLYKQLTFFGIKLVTLVKDQSPSYTSACRAPWARSM